MNRIIKMKHWQMFAILMPCLILSMVIPETEASIGKIDSNDIGTIFQIFGMVLFFSWLLLLGLALNKINGNPHRFNNKLLIFFTIMCILGYTDLNFISLFEDRNPIPEIVSTILFPFTFAGFIYIFINVPKSLKSIELNEKVKFSEHLLDGILLFFFPIGIWIIQPRINKLSENII